MQALSIFDRLSALLHSSLAGLFMRFGIVGIASTLLYFGLALAIRAMAATSAMTSSFTAYCIAAVFSYSAHRGFTFSSSQAHGQGLPRFAATTLLGLFLSSALPFVIHDVLAFPVIIAFATVCVVIPVTNLLLLYFWVFPSAATTAAARNTNGNPVGM